MQYGPDEIVQLVVMEDTLLLKLKALHDRGTDLTWATTTLGVGISLGATKKPTERKDRRFLRL